MGVKEGGFSPEKKKAWRRKWKQEERQEKVSSVLKLMATVLLVVVQVSSGAPWYGRQHLGLPNAGSVRVVPTEQKQSMIEGDGVCTFRKDVKNRA